MTEPPDDQSLKELAFNFLKLGNDSHKRASQVRDYYAAISKQSGLTLKEIAEAYGVTEGAVRKMIKRHEVRLDAELMSK